VFDLRAPLPSYGLVFDGQKLLLAQAYLLAGQKDAAGVREILGEDVRFWRRVLASSDILITKMIAVVALNRSFGVGNLVLRRLPAELQLQAMPQEWTTQLTHDERSLLRTFTGEWVLGDHWLQQSIRAAAFRGVSDLDVGDDWADELLGRALMPFYQAQDVSNHSAEMFIRAAEAMNVPFEQMPKGLKRADAIVTDPSAEGGSFKHLYNPMGHLVLWTNASNLGRYGARVADVEGARRAAVLATELRSRKVKLQDIPAQIAASPIRTPYTGEAFMWDVEEQAIVFVGLEPSERARHAFKL
jgi:hypothetical protein